MSEEIISISYELDVANATASVPVEYDYDPIVEYDIIVASDELKIIDDWEKISII